MASRHDRSRNLRSAIRATSVVISLRPTELIVVVLVGFLGAVVGFIGGFYVMKAVGLF